MDSNLLATEKGHRCLGLGCDVVLTDGKWFCPHCKRIKNRVKLSGIELKFVSDISHRAVKIGGMPEENS